MLTPGIAGGVTMLIANALWVAFSLPPRWTSLVLSFLLGLLVFVATRTRSPRRKLNTSDVQRGGRLKATHSALALYNGCDGRPSAGCGEEAQSRLGGG